MHHRHHRHHRNHEQDPAARQSGSVAARLGAHHTRDWRRLVVRVYHFWLWLFFVLLLIIQPLGFVWRRMQTKAHVYYGRFPQEGLFMVSGSTNDEPFTDRAIVCSLVGRLYKPIQLSDLLATTNKSSEPAATASIHGYRVISRGGHSLAPETRDFHANTCDQIATTLDSMLAACSALGYNVSDVEFLRVVPSDDTVVTLPTTLPVLILPFWDNARSARYVVPGHDGHACMFRLDGKYKDVSLPTTYMNGINRSTREAKTAEWLGLPREGVWRHGWYEDPKTQARWYSDVYSTQSPDAYGLWRRQFDTSAGTETDCVNTKSCVQAPSKSFWGPDLYVIGQSLSSTSITILDVNRNGIFMYDGENQYQTFSTYRLETVIANVSVTMLLFRWLVALVATLRVGQTIGIGALSCARSFHVLPIVLLPRMKIILAAFWTTGCVFEGDQRSLSEAWFVMYPSIAEFTLLFFSLLNLGAKLLRRRVSDVLFGPTVLLLCLLHRMRTPIADSGLFEMSGRVSTRMSSSRFDALQLVDFVSPSIMFQLNGMIPSIFAMKLALLALNLVPVVFFSDNTSVRSRVRAGIVRCDGEKALALRVACSGGLGRSAVYDSPTQTKRTALPTVRSNRNLDAIVPLPPKSAGVRNTAQHQASLPTGTLLPYELARAGYIVLGRDALVSMRDWFWFMTSAPCRAIGIPMRHLRMVTFTLTEDDDVDRDTRGVSNSIKAWNVSERPTMCRVTDERFHHIGAWEISVQPLR